MAFWSAIPIVGNVIDGVIDLVDQGIEDKDEAAKIKGRLTEVFQKADLAKFAAQIKAQASVVMAEIQGESWLQRNWRPILMLTIVAIVANNYLLAPYLQLFGAPSLQLPLPQDLWDLMKIGVGGYVVGRSGEKAVRAWRQHG